jgi:hypothetical protein
MRRFVIVALLVGGCPGDDSGTPGSYVAVNDFASAYKDAECTYLVRCGTFPDKATCMSAQLVSTVYRLYPDLVAAIEMGTVIYNGNNVQTCFDAIANATCDRTDEAGRVLPIECRAFTRGTLAADATCAIDAECISGTCQQTSEICGMGTCVGDTPPSIEPHRNGSSCTSGTGCVSGSFCDPQSNICTTLKSAGESCYSGAENECAYGLGCAGTSASARTCKTLPGVNEPCLDGECRDDGLWCNAGTCMPIGLAGAACSSSYACSQYYTCDFSTSTCKKLPSLGEACGGQTGNCLDENTYCDSSLHCVASKPDGAACSSYAECQSLYCDATSTCVTQTTCF